MQSEMLQVASPERDRCWRFFFGVGKTRSSDSISTRPEVLALILVSLAPLLVWSKGLRVEVFRHILVFRVFELEFGMNICWTEYWK